MRYILVMGKVMIRGILLVLLVSSVFFASDVSAGALEPGKPLKIYILDSGFNPAEAPDGVAKDLVLHDTASGGDGTNTFVDDHGTAMVKEYYTRLAPDIRAGKVELHVVKMQTNASGAYDGDSAVQAMEMAHRDGAHIVNMSFGSATVHVSDEARVKTVLDNMQQNGTVILHSVGNEGDTFLGKEYVDDISTHLGVISVGGLDPTQNHTKISNYSSGSATGRVDVYASTVTADGGTSTATAYAGALIAKNFVDGDLDLSFDYDGDGKLRGREVISFLNSPKGVYETMVGADFAAYKTLLQAGYRYDEAHDQFFITSADGTRTYIVPRDIGIYEQPSVIAKRMQTYAADPETYDDNERMDLYYDIGMRPFNWGKNTADPEARNVSEQIFAMSIDLKNNGWVYDAQAGVFKKDGFNTTIDPARLKNMSVEDYCRYMRYMELQKAGYHFTNHNGDNMVIMRNDHEALINNNAVNKSPYTYNDLSNDAVYRDLLTQKSISPDDAAFSAKSSPICGNDVQQAGAEPRTQNPSTGNATTNTPPQSSAGGDGSGAGADRGGAGMGGATTPATNGALVNCGKSGQPSCTICDLIAGMHGIVQWLIKVMIVAALVVITVAGIMYIVSAGGSLTHVAAGAVKYTLVGITVVLVAFLVITFLLNRVFSVNTQLVGEGGLKGLGSQTWQFSCTAAPTGMNTSR